MESTGDECMDEFLLGEKNFNSVDVSELVKPALVTALMWLLKVRSESITLVTLE